MPQALLSSSPDMSFSNFLTISTSLVFLYFLIKWTFRKNPRRNNKKNFPPSPPSSLPIIGHLHLLGQQAHHSLRELSRQSGSADLMLLRLGSIPTLVASSAAAAREIMKTHDANFADRPYLLSGEKLFYNFCDVINAPYGEYWRQFRSVCVVHLLSVKNVRSFRRVREEETALMVDKIRRSNNSEVNLSELFFELSNDVISRVALGRKYNEGNGGEKFKDLFTDFTDSLGSFCVGDYIPSLSWFSRVTGLTSRMERVAKRFDQFLEQVVEEHKQKQDVGNEDDKNNFVDILLSIQKENSLGFPIDITAIKALILDVFLAGSDSSSTTLSWAMAELLRHPNAMKKLQDEVRTISNNKTFVSEDDIEKMLYLKSVLKETFRLHPPLPILVPRVAAKDVNILGYDVASGSRVFVNAWAIGRDPIIWGNDGTEEFRPERFLDNEIDYKGQDFELLPFGAGRRSCPGINFSASVIEIALANAVCSFNWSLPNGSYDLDMSEIGGMIARRKLPLILVPKIAD